MESVIVPGFQPFSSGHLHSSDRLLLHGFTLIELLVVISIAAIMLGLAAFNGMPSQRQMLQKEAQRIAFLLQLARDEAIVRDRPVAFEADTDRYRFLVREENSWQPIEQNELLRQRAFKQAPVTLSMSPPSAEKNEVLHIVFGREPIDRPFVLKFLSGAASAEIHADGIGHFVVE